MGGSLQPRYEADSACPATNLPLMQLEPLLRDFADQRAAGSLHFHRELIDFEQDADGVTATIRNHDSGRDERMRARYLVAADGGKTVGRQLGIEMIGPRKLRRMINTYFAADLSPYIDDATLIYYFINPELRGQWAGGGLVKTGPTRWDRNSETWVLFWEVSPDEEETADVVALADRIRSLLKLPASLRIDIRKVGHWMSAVSMPLRTGVGVCSSPAMPRIATGPSAPGLNTKSHWRCAQSRLEARSRAQRASRPCVARHGRVRAQARRRARGGVGVNRFPRARCWTSRSV